MSTQPLSMQEILRIDQQHIWHPYASFQSHNPLFVVDRAEGVHLHLASGETLIDGMSSWWSTLHGYNHPELNAAAQAQMGKMAHVMFGGFTHEPAARLAAHLVRLSPDGLNKVFFSDSGSVAVEVALKMAIQYWHAKGQTRTRMLTIKRGYHGDTFAAMSVCDPVTGMHTLFSEAIMPQLFAEQPRCRFDGHWDEKDADSFLQLLETHEQDIAAVILEPIVQGTGGMHFYHPNYLKTVREATEARGIPLIADEIATGFGRTGRLFACEHADITPDILCLGKTLSAGYLTLAATLCSDTVAETICSAEPGVFMHGPTFMGNPTACAVAARSIELLEEHHWASQVQNLERALQRGLAPCRDIAGVREVRVLGGIGVVEMDEPVDLKLWQPAFVRHGIWLRPFGRLIYMMPPYISTEDDIARLCEGLLNTLKEQLRAA